MTHPDSTVAFDADASHSSEADALRARLAEIEGPSGQAALEPDEIIDPDGPSDGVEISKVHVATIAGEEWSFHAPKQAALLAFGLGSANRRNGQLVMQTLQRFLAFHLLEDDFDRFLERMTDPSDDFDDESFGDLVNAIVDTGQNTTEAKAPKNGPRK